MSKYISVTIEFNKADELTRRLVAIALTLEPYAGEPADPNIRMAAYIAGNRLASSAADAHQAFVLYDKPVMGASIIEKLEHADIDATLEDVSSPSEKQSGQRSAKLTLRTFQLI